MNTSPRNYDLPRALRALRALNANPDDLPQVFTVLESLRGGTLARMERRMAMSDGGRRLLVERPDLVPLLEDRESLRRMPAGSLAHAYLDFVESEGISAAGIREADTSGRFDQPSVSATETWLHHRMRDTHDLWHAVTGYRGDVLGEAALLGFTLAQSWNVGVALIVALGLAKTGDAPEARRLILEGWHRGRSAAWFPEQPWESLLARPAAEVRRELRVGRPPVYTPVRTVDLQLARAA